MNNRLLVPAVHKTTGARYHFVEQPDGWLMMMVMVVIVLAAAAMPCRCWSVTMACRCWSMAGMLIRVGAVLIVAVRPLRIRVGAMLIVAMMMMLMIVVVVVVLPTAMMPKVLTRTKHVF